VTEGLRDPLVGQREAINRGELEHLLWPDCGKGCPVEVGQVFSLRRCGVEITRTHRVQKGRRWMWRAEFTRIEREARPGFLDRRRGGYVGRASDGMQAQDAIGATIDAVSPAERSQEHRDAGEPPEPEPVPSGQVAQLPSTVAAQARFARLRRQVDQERRVRHLAGKLRRLQKRAEMGGIDLSRQIEAVEKALADAESAIKRVA
jgi:hypothetical protein